MHVAGCLQFLIHSTFMLVPIHMHVMLARNMVVTGYCLLVDRQVTTWSLKGKILVEYLDASLLEINFATAKVSSYYSMGSYTN